MRTEKKIVFLSPWYPDKKDPMPGLFVQRHALAANLYNDVKVLYVKGYPDQEQTEKVLSVDPLYEYRIYCNSGKGIFKRLKYYNNFLREHFTGLAVISDRWEQKPDLVHVNILTREGAIALLWKKLYGIPYVITEHWSRYQTGTYKGIFRKIISQYVVKNAAAVLPVTQHLQKSMVNCGLKSNNYQVISNVVDVKKFHPLERSDNVIKQILHISCFSDEPKNISGIIDTALLLAEKRKDFKLVFVGDGEDFEILKAYAFSQLNGESVFEFKGLLEGDALVKEIHNSDFHVMFSRYENLPVVNLECFACGIPVISSDVGGIREHLPKSLGELVPSGDKQALFRAMDKMLDNLDAYDKNVIRNYAVSHFSQETIGIRFSEIYDAAISGIKF